MGQTVSRRHSTSTPTPASTVATEPRQPDNTHTSRRSLPRRILSSIPKPSLRSHPLSSSLTLPTRSEQTLRGKNRRWRLSRRHDVPANIEGAVPEHMGSLTEHDEHQVDRDVDEFGVMTHRVPDNHSDSPAGSTKGKQKAKDISDTEDDTEHDDDTPIPSTSTAPPLAQSGTGRDPVGDDEVVVSPTVTPSPSPPRQSSPLPPAQGPERSSVPTAPIPPSPLQPSTQQPNTNPRPFPPPGTLVVVQGVVHTTDVPRSSDRPLNPIAPTTNGALNLTTNSDPSSIRPSSAPPETRSRNPLSAILPRPSGMVPSIPSPPPDPTFGPNNDSSARQTTSSPRGAVEESEDDDRVHRHPHGISMAQGPVGAPGLSASSIDVLGTLLRYVFLYAWLYPCRCQRYYFLLNPFIWNSVAAAATAASLLTGSSEPIFSSGLTSQPSPPSNPIPQTTVLNPNVPSERPLSPTPTSDAGRMRHVWSSLRDRLGLGSGTHSSSPSNDTTSSLGSGQVAPQATDVIRPRDPREIMLAEMARAFNLGLGLGGATTTTPSTVTSANSNNAELAMPDDGDGLAGDRDGEQTSLPPPDSFERFLLDLQTDLRVTLMQDQEPSVIGGVPRDVDETAEDIEGDRPIPELQSLSDSDSEEFGTRRFESDDEDELDCEDGVDNEGDGEDVHTAQEQLSERISPTVSALSAGTRHSFDIGINPGSHSLGAGGVSSPHTAPSQPASTTIPPGTDEVGASNFAMDSGKSGDIAAHAPFSDGIGTYVSANESSQSEVQSEEEPGGQGAVVGVAHSREASNGGRREAEGYPTVSGSIAVPPLDVQNHSNAPESGTGRGSFLPETSSSSSLWASNTPNSFPGRSSSISQAPIQPSTSRLLSDPALTTQNISSTNPTPGDSSMPFRLPFTPSSASRTEHTPGGGINWWRMYRFPAIASPNLGQQGGPQGSSPSSQPAFRTTTQVPTPTSPWARTTDQNQQNETITSRGMAQVPGAHNGPAQPVVMPSAASPTNVPEIASAFNQTTGTSASTNGQDFNPPTNTSTNSSEHRSNIVVPVIVVGLQSVNMDRQAPRTPHPHANHTPAIDDEDGEGMEFDGLDPMSMPLHIPEPAEFRHHPNLSSTIQQEPSGQQPSRGRTWHSRAANAIRNLRPSRRNADATSPPPQEAPGSRTFLIYVIGGTSLLTACAVVTDIFFS